MYVFSSFFFFLPANGTCSGLSNYFFFLPTNAMQFAPAGAQSCGRRGREVLAAAVSARNERTKWAARPAGRDYFWLKRASI